MHNIIMLEDETPESTINSNARIYAMGGTLLMNKHPFIKNKVGGDVLAPAYDMRHVALANSLFKKGKETNSIEMQKLMALGDISFLKEYPYLSYQIKDKLELIDLEASSKIEKGEIDKIVTTKLDEIAKENDTTISEAITQMGIDLNKIYPKNNGNEHHQWEMFDSIDLNARKDAVRMYHLAKEALDAEETPIFLAGTDSKPWYSSLVIHMLSHTRKEDDGSFYLEDGSDERVFFLSSMKSFQSAPERITKVINSALQLSGSEEFKHTGGFALAPKDNKGDTIIIRDVRDSFQKISSHKDDLPFESKEYVGEYKYNKLGTESEEKTGTYSYEPNEKYSKKNISYNIMKHEDLVEYAKNSIKYSNREWSDKKRQEYKEDNARKTQLQFHDTPIPELGIEKGDPILGKVAAPLVGGSTIKQMTTYLEMLTEENPPFDSAILNISEEQVKDWIKNQHSQKEGESFKEIIEAMKNLKETGTKIVINNRRDVNLESEEFENRSGKNMQEAVRPNLFKAILLGSNIDEDLTEEKDEKSQFRKFIYNLQKMIKDGDIYVRNGTSKGAYVRNSIRSTTSENTVNYTQTQKINATPLLEEERINLLSLHIAPFKHEMDRTIRLAARRVDNLILEALPGESLPSWLEQTLVDIKKDHPNLNIYTTFHYNGERMTDALGEKFTEGKITGAAYAAAETAGAYTIKSGLSATKLQKAINCGMEIPLDETGAIEKPHLIDVGVWIKDKSPKAELIR